MTPCPKTLVTGRHPRINISVGGTILLLYYIGVSVCNTILLPIALGKLVELLGYGSSSACNLKVELPAVLIEECIRNVLGAHVGWIPWPRNLPQGKQSSGLLFLNPQDVDFYVSELRDPLSLHDADGSTSIHADARLHGRAAKVGK